MCILTARKENIYIYIFLKSKEIFKCLSKFTLDLFSFFLFVDVVDGELDHIVLVDVKGSHSIS